MRCSKQTLFCGLLIPLLSLPLVSQAQTTPEQPLPNACPNAASCSANLPKLDLPYWQQLPSGVQNNLLDVAGLDVEQLSWFSSTWHTGVTFVLPRAKVNTQGKGHLGNTCYPAAGVILQGNGELTGLSFIESSGCLNGPIALTSTRALGQVWEGVGVAMRQRYKQDWLSQLPIVGECWDGRGNLLWEETPITAAVVTEALLQSQASYNQTPSPRPLLQGRVGAGSGMKSFGLWAGLGSASRKVGSSLQHWTVGVLVNNNHSRLQHLNPVAASALEAVLHQPLKQVAEEDKAQAKPLQSAANLAVQRQGSIQIILATDLPASPAFLKTLAQHAGLGLAALGSHQATSSGDFVLAFSTANATVWASSGQGSPNEVKQAVLSDETINQFYRAALEATVEAQLNAILAAHIGLVGVQ
jgi:D-aminopeptidase